MIERINKLWVKELWIMVVAGLSLLLFCNAPVLAAGLKNINVANGATQSIVTVTFDGPPVYSFFSLHNPDRVVMDVNQSGVMRGLPLNFNGKNIVKHVRASTPKDATSQRLVFELTRKVRTNVEKQQNGNQYTVVFTLDAVNKPVPTVTRPVSQNVNPFNLDKSNATALSSKPAPRPDVASKTHETKNKTPVIVAIDAGHGGQDPGALGQHGLKEKNVTIAIARKLQAELSRDPMFKPVLTRDGDYFISVMGRSDVARKKGANVLVSIHADAAPNRSATGASVWVLSNRRANSELGDWLEQHEKQSELLGGAGDVLANTSTDPYLSQAVLDLQFGHSQRVGYDVATKVLRELSRIGALHKRKPEHASLGVLRSPDIPSLLVETGFISNAYEERLLGSSAYQDKIAHAIHAGLRSYFLAHPLQSVPTVENRPQLASPTTEAAVTSSSPPKLHQPAATATQSESIQIHVVTRGETLGGIANRYGTTMSILRNLNRLKKDSVWVGQRLKVPAAARSTSTSKTMKPIKYRVTQGDTLSAIASKYGVSMNNIKTANHMASANVQLGQTLTIPQS